MIIKVLPFIRKRSHKKSDPSELDEGFQHGIPSEIFVHESVAVMSSPQYRNDQLHHVAKTSRVERRQRARHTVLNISTEMGPKGRASIVDDLLRGADDDTGPVTRVDDLCFGQVIKMMSINDAARKELFDGMLNRGEF